MNAGLLWFDGDPARPIAEKVSDAARRFHQKFQAPATDAHVSLKDLPGGTTEMRVTVEGFDVLVHGDMSVLPNHVWIGY